MYTSNAIVLSFDTMHFIFNCECLNYHSEQRSHQIVLLEILNLDILYPYPSKQSTKISKNVNVCYIDTECRFNALWMIYCFFGKI